MAEHQTVALGAVGSSPIIHPNVMNLLAPQGDKVLETANS